MVKLLLITFQRTGSTHLVRSLDKNINVKLSGELLYNGSGVYNAEFKFKDCNFTKNKTINQIIKLIRSNFYTRRHLNQYFAFRHEYDIVGFKLMLSQLLFVPMMIFYILRNPDVKIVFLTRRKVFECAMSNYYASETGVYHSWEKQGSSQQNPTTIELRKLRKLVSKVKRSNTVIICLSKLFRDSLLMDHDNLFDLNDAFGKIEREYGIKLKSSVENNPREDINIKYKKKFTNYEVIKAKFR